MEDADGSKAPGVTESSSSVESAKHVGSSLHPRRSSARWVALVVVLAGTGVGCYLAVGGPSNAPSLRHGASAGVTTTSGAGPVAQSARLGPKHPWGLAAGANGALYMVDTGRDQILERLPSGSFEVVAGTGQEGFSGDDGPAFAANLSLTNDSGIAVATDGTVYFSDTGNGRVRAVAPDGVITTVAGGGTTLLATATAPALDASFGPIGPEGLAIGPGGDLFIGGPAVYELTDGTLHWVVGAPPEVIPPPSDWQGVYANPGAQTDFAPAVRLAFDGQGDLMVAGGGGFGLYEDTTSGSLVFLENFRGDGEWGSIAASPAGDLVLAARDGITVFASPDTFRPLSVDLDPLLGLNAAHRQNEFIGGDGVAVGPDGEIYVDTNTGNTFTSVSALIEIGSDGSSPSVLWKS